MSQVKHTFEITLGIKMEPDMVRAVGEEPVFLPNGEALCPVLKNAKASATVDIDTEETEARKQAIRNACYFFKRDNPDYEDAFLVPADVTPTRKMLVTDES